MPRRKRSPDSAISPNLDPDTQKTLEALNRLDNVADCATRARLLETLGTYYRILHMYGRCIQMYECSLSASRAEGVCYKLAECYIHLLGEYGFGKARTLVRDLPSEFVIENLIKRKQAAIAQRQRKIDLVKQYPPLSNIVGKAILL